MRRAILASLSLVLLFCGVSIAATQRQLTPEELGAITAYLDQRNAELGKVNSRPLAMQVRRRPDSLTREYEEWKYDKVKQRWTSRPKFPGWDDPCHRWSTRAQTYQAQLYCSKCKGYNFGDGKPCSGFVNPNGFACWTIHPAPFMEQWRFAVNLIAGEYKKPMEAKAHLWNALESRKLDSEGKSIEERELTEVQWDELMVLVDSIEAEAKAKAERKPVH